MLCIQLLASRAFGRARIPGSHHLLRLEGGPLALSCLRRRLCARVRSRPWETQLLVRPRVQGAPVHAPSLHLATEVRLGLAVHLRPRDGVPYRARLKARTHLLDYHPPQRVHNLAFEAARGLVGVNVRLGEHLASVDVADARDLRLVEEQRPDRLLAVAGTRRRKARRVGVCAQRIRPERGHLGLIERRHSVEDDGHR